jgi:outer membrane receptor for ferrienterochelin and colicins
MLMSTATDRDANIFGHVIDAKSGEHLSDVTIVVKGTSTGIATDATGHYFLKDLPTGNITLTASLVGYATVEKTVTLEDNKTVELNFEIEEQSFALDEVIVSATRNEARKQESGVIVNVISAKLFETVSSSNLSETMNFLPGLRLETNCSNCGFTQLRINGLDGQYSQILMDGRPIFSSLATVYGLEQLPVSMIERVEVVRGGGSALFGSNAIGGVVNIITKEPLRNSLTLTNSTSIVGNGKTDVNTSVNGSFVADDHRAGVYIFGTLKDRNHYDRNGDGFSDIPKIKSETLGFKGYYRTGTYSKITAEYHRIHEMRRGGNNFDNPPHEADIAEYLNSNINGGGLRFDLFSPDYAHRLLLYTSAQDIKRDSYFAGEINTNNYGTTFDRTLVAGSQYTYVFDHLWLMPAELTGGIEYSVNDLNDKYVALNRTIAQTGKIFGAFIQNEWKSEHFGILLSTRLDKHNMMERPVLCPRGTLRYNFSDNINFRASYSSGYRAPQAYNEDMHIEAVNGTLSLIELDPSLRPEYSHSISASADLYHSFGRLHGNLLVEGFHTMLNDVFTLEKATNNTDSQGNIVYVRRNAAGARVSGVNLEARLVMPGIFDLQLGYTIQQSRYRKPEQWSSNLPAQQKMFRAPDSYGYFMSNFDLSHAWKLSLFGNHTGSMLVKHTYEDVDMEKHTRNFFDVGIKLACHFHLGKSSEIEINGGVKNIFDSFQPDPDFGQNKDSSYIYGPAFPRMFFAGVKFSL